MVGIRVENWSKYADHNDAKEATYRELVGT